MKIAEPEIRNPEPLQVYIQVLPYKLAGATESNNVRQLRKRGRPIINTRYPSITTPSITTKRTFAMFGYVRSTQLQKQIVRITSCEQLPHQACNGVNMPSAYCRRGTFRTALTGARARHVVKASAACEQSKCLSTERTQNREQTRTQVIHAADGFNETTFRQALRSRLPT